MPDIPEDLCVFLMLSDYANVDSGGKVNVIGGAVSSLGFAPDAGRTSAFALLAIARGGETMEGREFSFELTLKNETHEPIALPGPAGPQVMRLGQNRKFVRSPEAGVPTEDVVTIYFESGLPLAPGKNYYWQASIDGAASPLWRAYFSVPSALSGPVTG